MILKHYFIFCQARKTFQRPRIFSVTVKKSSSMKWIQLSGEDSITGHPGGVDQSHLQMFTKAYTKLSNTQWKNGPKTTNPVETINRQSVNEKGSSLYALLEKYTLKLKTERMLPDLLRCRAKLRYRIQIQKRRIPEARLLPKENFREPFGLPKIKVGSPSHNFRSPELISDLAIN